MRAMQCADITIARTNNYDWNERMIQNTMVIFSQINDGNFDDGFIQKPVLILQMKMGSNGPVTMNEDDQAVFICR